MLQYTDSKQFDSDRHASPLHNRVVKRLVLDQNSKGDLTDRSPNRAEAIQHQQHLAKHIRRKTESCMGPRDT